MKTISRYTIVARPDVRRAVSVAAEPGLTKAKLEQAISGAVVHGVSKDWGDRTVTIDLQRETHAQALKELTDVIECFGFMIVSATVSDVASELMDEAVTAAILGFVGEPAAEVPAVAFMAKTAGVIAGQVTGKEVRKVLAEYVGIRDGLGIWSVHRITGQQTATLPTARHLANPIAVRAGQYGGARASATLTPNWSGSLPRHYRHKF